MLVKERHTTERKIYDKDGNLKERITETTVKEYDKESERLDFKPVTLPEPINPWFKPIPWSEPIKPIVYPNWSTTTSSTIPSKEDKKELSEMGTLFKIILDNYPED